MVRTTIVTGAASGIGLGVARWFAVRGHRVAMIDRTEGAVAAASSELNSEGHQTRAFALDVTDREALSKAYEAVRTEFGPIEVLIANAGISEYCPFMDMTIEHWHRMIDTNLTSMFHCIQLALPDMLTAQWGRVVTISSMSAQVGGPNLAHYSASKGGVTSLTKALAREFAENGVTFNTIPPAIVLTGLSRRTEVEGKNPRIDAMVQSVPVKRIGTPEDIASACEWLSSDQASYVTGQEINVNGGMYS